MLRNLLKGNIKYKEKFGSINKLLQGRLLCGENDYGNRRMTNTKKIRPPGFELTSQLLDV